MKNLRIFLVFEDLFLKHGWRTGAILEEVEDEINIINSDAFQKTIRWVKSKEKFSFRFCVFLFSSVNCSSMVNRSNSSD